MMDKKKVGTVVVVALLAGTVVVPDHEQAHIEEKPTTPEPALLTDDAIISTWVGSPPRLFVNSPNQFE
jgi:hypothetical protein